MIEHAPLASRLRGSVIRSTNRSIAFLEERFTDKSSSRLPATPIFIIGPPRSGSTLLYQLVTAHYDFAYLSNAHCRLFGAPALVERILHDRIAEYPPQFESKYGRTEGWGSPAECGEFWYRWFPRHPQYTSLEDADPETMRKMRGTIRSLMRASGRPIVFKNLHCSLRIRPLGTYLPEALFIVVRRNTVDNARSILAGRFRNLGDYSTWWSVEPPEIEQLRTLPPAEQAVRQIDAIHALIDRDRSTLGPERFLELSYESLCASPKRAMKALDDFLIAHSVGFQHRANLPDEFPQRGSRLSEELERQLAHHADR